MTDAVIDFHSLVRSWISITRECAVSVPSPAEVERDLEKIKTGELPDSFGWDDSIVQRILTAVSCWTLDLLNTYSPSETAVQDVRKADTLVVELNVTGDEMGEIAELRRRLAFIGWRHCRALGQTAMAQEWLERYDALMLQDSAERDCLLYFLQLSKNEHSSAVLQSFLSDAENLFALCSLLRERRNCSPADLVGILLRFRECVQELFVPVAFEHEKKYFLAQLEISLGVCARFRGDRVESLQWHRNASRTAEDLPDRDSVLAEIEFSALIVKYEMGFPQNVRSHLKHFQGVFRELRMDTAFIKSKMLESSLWKSAGAYDRASSSMEEVIGSPVLAYNEVLRAYSYEFLADSYVLEGRSEDAIRCCEIALTSLGRAANPIALGYLELIFGEALRLEGNLVAAIDRYRSSLRRYEDSRLPRWVVYTRLLIAEALLALGRDSEANAEIAEATPLIVRHRLLPESLSIVAMLREAGRGLDRFGQLRLIRERFQSRNN